MLDEELQFRVQQREGAEFVLAWQDLSGDHGDLFEFICDVSVPAKTVSQFELIAVQCQFERKNKVSHTTATQADLLDFSFSDQPVPEIGGSPAIRSPASSQILSPQQQKEMAPRTPLKSAATAATTEAPPARARPEGGAILAQETAQLHLFDFESGTFVEQDAETTATVHELGGWNYWLSITSSKRDWLGQPIVDEINPVFNFEYQSFIFNHYTEDGSAYSWLLRFQDMQTLERWQDGVMRALWEHLNQVKWSKIKDDERDYVLDAFNKMVLEDGEGEAGKADDGEEEDEEEEASEDEAGPRSSAYDSDEDEGEDRAEYGRSKEINSQLAVGHMHDRSFVVRGSNIGVFKHGDKNELKFATNISKVQTPGKEGKSFSPKKVMLHMQDRDLVMQDPNNPNSLYRMDLELGKVVDEWKVDDDIAVRTYNPASKFAQTTAEQTLVGVGANSLFKIDPRLDGNKLVQEQFKQYASKNDFTSAATTEQGYLAVASNKGDIRLFDRLGIQAKTLLPALGEPFIGVDVSADGRWILGTCKTYLLLIDAKQKEGKNAGKLGFEKAFGKDAKPAPRRLAISPNHVAQFQHETKTPISFTPAHFNTGEGVSETTIVTATGPFVITWSMKKLLRGEKDAYKIKRYEDNVRADNFRYGTDKNMIVAMSDDVGMLSKGQLRRPTRDSIVGTPVRSSLATPRRSTRASGLRRSEVVDSPY